ncbi:formyltransferase family protein [Halorussus ruber]|uniref:formyltransferase family protein n=1 Tax=Halorussus ruber TaxID=1126238 RepID=UPI00143DBE09|nr:formyltransferase family protein [Halorussus ruber]
MSTRVAVVTQDDPFYMPTFFESFLSDIPDGVEIVDVVVLRSFDESTFELARRMYGLYGPVNFVRRGFQYAYRTLAKRFVGGFSVAAVAQKQDVPVSHRESVNTDEFVSWVGHEDIDVILSVAAPEIFEPEVLKSPDWGCLNVHTAELPKYRGMLPTFWALYHGEDEIGVTVHTMEEEIDRGEIVRQATFPVEFQSLDRVITKGKEIGGALAATALGDVERDEVTRTPMEGQESYFSFPTAEDRREFQRRGGKLL